LPNLCERFENAYMHINYKIFENKCGKPCFLMTLPPDMMKKGGLTEEVFKSDKNGLTGNLVMEEGETWQMHRKIISKMLHLDILEKYIEPMDISAMAFASQLSKTKSYQVLYYFCKLKDLVLISTFRFYCITING